MASFAVTLHAGHLPSAGAASTARFIGPVLSIEGPVPQQVPVADLKVSVGGFNDTTLFLNWVANGVRYAVIPLDEAARQQLFAQAPASLLPQLKKGQGSAGRQIFVWNAVVASLVAVVALIGLAWWQSHAVTGWLAKQVPLKTEQRLGEAVLAQVKAEGKLSDKGPAADMVKSVGEKLTKGSRYTYKWYVKDDDTVNAFAAPGGLVVVHSGLIKKASSAEEVAGVLAHEVQHVELRHSLQQMIHTAGWAAILAVTLGDVTAITGVLLHQMGNLSHSRQLETEADIKGLQALARAGIPQAGMASFFKKLAAEKKDDFEIALLSSHPATTERLAAIERLQKATPCPACKPLVFDWAAIQADVAGDEAIAKPDAKAEKPAGKTGE